MRDDVSTDFAIEWIKQNRDRPFSIVVGYKSPHSPRGGKNLLERLRNLYAGETSRPTPNCAVPAIFEKPDPKTGQHASGLADNAIHLDYFRHVAGMDENLGRLLSALDQLGLAEDTVVIYSSDNGYYLGEPCRRLHLENETGSRVGSAHQHSELHCACECQPTA